ncbi:MAG: acetylserotonin O-methyltransferase [Acidobacteriota bacterium]|nr:acetylserotonin O-methyltransferase [Acidobacteriota bacterium]
MNASLSTLPESEKLTELLNLATGYQKARVLFTFTELGIADILREKSLSADEISEVTKINKLATERFLNAGVSIGILEKVDECYKNSAVSELFLLSENEFYLGGQINRYSERSYPVWQDLTKHLKDWEYGETDEATPEAEDQGAEAMAEQHNLSLLHGCALARAFDFSKYKKVLDLGGGTGAMSIGLCRSYPNLRAVVFDLPENIEIARKFIAESGLANRIECVGGDFQKDELPEGFDIALLANFMSVADVSANKKILRRIFDKLPNGGACLLSGLIMDDSRLSPQTAVLFCLEDICWNAPDVERSEKVYTEWLREAGFENISCETYLEPTKLMRGFKV